MGRAFIIALKHRLTRGYWEIKVGGLGGLSIAEINDFHEAFPPFKAISLTSEDGAFIWTNIHSQDSFPPIEIVQKILNQISGGYDTVCTSTTCVDGNEREFIWTLTRN